MLPLLGYPVKERHGQTRRKPAEDHWNAQWAEALGMGRELGFFSQEKTKIREGNLFSISKYLLVITEKTDPSPTQTLTKEWDRATVVSCNKGNFEQIWGDKTNHHDTMRWWSVARLRRGWATSSLGDSEDTTGYSHYQPTQALTLSLLQAGGGWVTIHWSLPANFRLYSTLFWNKGSLACLNENKRKRLELEWGPYRDWGMHWKMLIKGKGGENNRSHF